MQSRISNKKPLLSEAESTENWCEDRIINYEELNYSYSAVTLIEQSIKKNYSIKAFS